MHKTNGNMSGQHRRQKRYHSLRFDCPQTSESFWKLRRKAWLHLKEMTDKEVKQLYDDYKVIEAYWNDPKHRDRGARTWWRYYRRETGAELKRRGVVLE